ncbi:MAG: glycoside hydrolase family 1 protein [Actinomycetota bacterium]
MPRDRGGLPAGFLVGAAGSAHQTEGDNTASDWWEHERAPGTTAREPSGKACDSWNRFAEDWRLAADAGLHAVRFSVEWARIEPAPGEISTAALDHYREVIGTARALGLECFVTLNHFTLPAWFSRAGGWLADDAAERFAAYARATCDALGDLLTVVNTINEPSSVAVAGYLFGYFPPRMFDLDACERATANLARAHRAATDSARAVCEARTGPTLSMMAWDPVDDSVEARRAYDLLHRLWQGTYLDAIAADDDDFIGVQYYTRALASPPSPGSPLPAELHMPHAERTTQMGWSWYPEGLGRVLDEAAATGKPMFVTENGIATADDDERIEYVDLHLDQVRAAIARGLDVRGYFYWSLLDNFEWNEGYRPTFGLVGVDRETFERQPKPSLAWLGEIARAVPQET